VSACRPATCERSHGERARYVHGPDENGTPGVPCRCAPCTAASSAYERHRERQALYGRWRPYVDAGPAREHLRYLASCGIGWRRAAALAGAGNGTVSKLLFGGPGDRPPTRRIRPETEAKILAVRPSLDALGSKALVDATGARRRLQALVALGHSQASLARRLSITPQNFTTTMAAQRLTAATARAIRDLYDQLWNVPPDESAHRARISASRARNTARASGWPPPLAWDDDQIDDPAAPAPEGWQRPKRLPAAELLEDAAELIRWEGSRELAAARLGVATSGLSTAIARAGRAS
jgi:hypothetical protein